MDWVRLWRDMPFDPKWRVIARASGQPLTAVVAVFTSMLIAAGDVEEDDARGSLHAWRADVVAAGFDLDEGAVAAIFEAMRGRVHADGRLSGWERRQPLREDYSTPRVRAHRERRAATGADETHGNARSEKSRESESRGEGARSNLRIVGGPNLTELKAAVFEACGAALKLSDPRVHDVTPVLGLMGPGRGPPCSLELDVLPAIRECSATAKPGSVFTLNFYKDPILRKRDRRLGGAPDIDPANQENPDAGTGARQRRRADAGDRRPAAGTMADVLAAERRSAGV